MPLLRSPTPPRDWRQYALNEIDYSDCGPRTLLDIAPYDCRATMVRNKRWKYIHHNLYRPQLFDMQEDPDELKDLGDDPVHEKIRRDMQQLLIDSRRLLKPRIGAPHDDLATMGPERDESRGIIIGRW